MLTVLCCRQSVIVKYRGVREGEGSNAMVAGGSVVGRDGKEGSCTSGVSFHLSPRLPERGVENEPARRAPLRDERVRVARRDSGFQSPPQVPARRASCLPPLALCFAASQSRLVKSSSFQVAAAGPRHRRCTLKCAAADDPLFGVSHEDDRAGVNLISVQKDDREAGPRPERPLRHLHAARLVTLHDGRLQ